MRAFLVCFCMCSGPLWGPSSGMCGRRDATRHRSRRHAHAHMYMYDYIHDQPNHTIEKTNTHFMNPNTHSVSRAAKSATVSLRYVAFVRFAALWMTGTGRESVCSCAVSVCVTLDCRPTIWASHVCMCVGTTTPPTQRLPYTYNTQKNTGGYYTDFSLLWVDCFPTERYVNPYSHDRTEPNQFQPRPHPHL